MVGGTIHLRFEREREREREEGEREGGREGESVMLCLR